MATVKFKQQIFILPDSGNFRIARIWSFLLRNHLILRGVLTCVRWLGFLLSVSETHGYNQYKGEIEVDANQYGPLVDTRRMDVRLYKFIQPVLLGY